MDIEVRNKTFLGFVLFGIVLLFLAPFIFGIIAVILSSMGLNLVWDTMSFDFSYFKILREPYIITQLIFAFLRVNIIGVVLFVSVFFAGYIVCLNAKRRIVSICMYIVSIPHISLALGFSFLIMPTGLLFRILAFFNMKDAVNYDSILNDKFGIAMSVVVLLKIIPFVVFVMLGSFSDYALQFHVLESKVLGRNSLQTWAFIIFPQLMPKIIMPFSISLMYALSPIDIASILGPRTPSSIGLIIQELATQSSKIENIQVDVISVAMLIVSLLTLSFWYYMFGCIKNLLRTGYSNPHVISGKEMPIRCSTQINIALFIVLIAISFFCVILWSFIIRWDYPGLRPTVVGFMHLNIYFKQVLSSINTSLELAFWSTIVATLLSVGILECLTALSWRHERIIIALLILPLLVPTIVYISGTNIFFLFLRINSSLFALVWGHALKTVPYMILLLYGTMKSYNHFFITQGRTLGKGYMNTLLKIKIPMIISPLSYAITISILVSIAEYVTTQFIGGGVRMTMTTAIVALNSSVNTQIMSLSGLILGLVNLIILFLGTLSQKLRRGYREVEA